MLVPLATAPAGAVPARRRARRPAVVPLDADLGARTEAELIARVLDGPEPAAAVVRCAADLARLPFWRRRALGATGLVLEHGIPPQRAVRLAALWELAERWFPDDRPSVSSPRDALLLLDDLRACPSERIAALLLDSRHRLIRRELVAVGTVNASRLSPRDVLAPALVAGAAAVVVAHNHPSGDATPSRADRQVTAALRQAATVVGVDLLDHLILGRREHHSFREAEAWTAAPG